MTTRQQQLQLDLDREFFTPADFAELLGTDERTITDWCRTYDWPCLRFGRKIRFTRDQVRQIIAAHTKAPGKKPASPEAAMPAPVVVPIAGQTKRSAARRSG